MRLCRVEIERFLGFKYLVLELDGHLQLIAGPNNAGKSSVVRLLELFFANPVGDELVNFLPLHKYYVELGGRTLSTIQLWFDDFTMDEVETFKDIIRTDKRMSVTLRCSRAGRVTYRASRKASAEESHRLYREVLDRFHFVKVPSVRVGSAGDRGEPDSLERLLDTLQAILIRTGTSRSTALQKDFAMRMDGVEKLVKQVLDESADAIKTDLPFQEREVRFRLPDARAALRGMLEAAVIESQGDVDVAVSSRGTGFQSALVLGILRHVASREAQSGVNVLFAIEEPEAFLHPQTQRAMAKIIRAIAADAQVLVTTHSAVLVDSFELSRVARLPLQSGGTTHRWTAPSLETADAGRLSRYCSAANSELVFANAVIFVEGEGDASVIERLLGRACHSPGGHYALGVTVIEAAGLGKIKYLVQLAEHFGVRSYVLADIDGTRKAGGSRVLLTILDQRSAPINEADRQALIMEADTHSHGLAEALRRQVRLNALLQPHDAFVLSSDLEGVLLDSFGVTGLVAALGPFGEAVIDPGFASALASDPNAYETLAQWLGSKGWNADRKKSGKLEPHLPAVLVDRWFEANAEPAAAMKPLCDWLDTILMGAAATPV